MNKTWQQWSALGAFIIYTLSLAGMFLFMTNNTVFFSLFIMQMLSLAWIGILLKKWPQGGLKP